MAVLTPSGQRRSDEVSGETGKARARKLYGDLLSFGALALYVVLVGSVALRHEPWFDEAQAWLLARDAPLGELFTKWLPMEGSPGLWHTLLALPARLGMPYGTMNILSASLGAVAAFLLLRRSPFPLVVKLFLPFTFFLFFQYAVVARSYSLLVPLVFAAAVAYPHKQVKPIPYLALIALVANTSAHGFLFAGSLFTLSALDVFKARKALPKELLLRHLAGMAGCGAILGLVAFGLRRSESSGFLDKTFKIDMDWFGSVGREAVTEFLAGSGWPTALVVAVSLLWFWRQKTLLLYLLPTTALFVFYSAVYFSIWHEGILFLVWLFAMWVSFGNRPESWDEEIPNSGQAFDRGLRSAATVAVLAVAAVHINWSITASRYDYEKPYSGSKAAAAFLEESGYAHRTVFGTGSGSLALLPYFERNIYANIDGGKGPTFWVWSLPRPMLEDAEKIVSLRPDLIVLSVKSAENETQPKNFPGYKTVGCFPGALAWKHGPIEPDAFILLAPASEPPLRTAFPEDPTTAIGCGTVVPGT